MSGELASLNAQLLERALVLGRRTLPALQTEAEREQRAEALLHIEGYMALLREPTNDHMQASRYSFKLVFPDGRWSIDEKQLVARPLEGDVVVFEGSGGWRIESAQRVNARPSGKPPREFFVCAPIAA